MPALITHHLFGEEAATRLPEGIISNQEEKLAFLLGNQGPDPLFFRFRALPPEASACHHLASNMHKLNVLETFLSLRDAVSHLREQDKTIGRAFSLGFLAHYALDSNAHPFIYAQEHAICNAGVGLEDAHSEVHAVIEGDLDSWMLWTMRSQTVEDCAPASMLARTGRISLVASALLSQVAWQAQHIPLDAEAYAGAVSDCELLYRTIEPAGSQGARTLAGAERLGRGHSILSALSHRVTRDPDCAAANLENRAWESPYTAEGSHESFPDIFFTALDLWPEMSAAFVKGDRQELGELAGRVDFDGRPTA